MVFYQFFNSLLRHYAGFRERTVRSAQLSALKARQEGLTIAGMIQTDVPTTGPDTLVADIMPIAAEAPYPIGVVDDDGQLMGIVTKANVLSSLI